LNNYEKGAIIVAGGVTAYLIADAIQSMQPGNGQSLVSRLFGTVASPVAAALNIGGGGCNVVSLVRTPYPLLSGSGVTDGTSGNQNLEGLRRIIEQEIGSGCGLVIAGQASIESQTGTGLVTNCHNCNPFNVHCRPSHQWPIAVLGTDRISSYVSNSPNQVEGFRVACRDFKALMNAAYPGALAAAASRDTATWLRILGEHGYGRSYRENLDPSKPHGIKDDFLARRIRRLRDAGFLSSDM